MTNIRKTYAEVMEEVANLSWSLMDPEQKATVAKHIGKKIGDVTRDGVKLTWATFAKSLGTSGDAIRKAAQRAEGPRTRADGLTQAQASTVRSVKALPASVKREIVKTALLDDPDVFTDKAVRAAAAQSVHAAFKPKPASSAPPRYTQTYADIALSKGIQFAAALQEARAHNSFTDAQEGELDEIVGSILDAYKGANV